MFRPSQLSVAVVIAAVAAWPASIAYSTGVLTPKQAKLQGLVATAKVREQKVDKLIVKLKAPKAEARASAMSGARVQALAKAAGIGMKALSLTGDNAQVMQLEQVVPLSQARAIAARLAQDADVEYVEPNVRFRALAVPNEPRFTQWQWNLFVPTSSYTGAVSGGSALTTTAIGAANLPAAWDYTTTSDIVVAVIDSGIVNHPDLNGIDPATLPVEQRGTYIPNGRFLPGYDFISSGTLGLPANFAANDGDGRDGDPSDPGDWITAQEKATYPDECTVDDESAPYKTSDSSWHGSHVAGVIAATANNALGIAGTSWTAKVLPVRALGKCGGDLLDIEAAIRWAAGLPVNGVPTNVNPAKVINLSLGGGNTCSQTMQAAVNAAIAAGSVVVAATGNAADIELIAPANCTGVIAVTAHTISGDNADYSNIGAETALSAPGGGSPFYSPASAPKHVADNSAYDGYYIFSTVLFGATTPTSASSVASHTGPAYTGFVGTSAAAPHVAGVAAMVKSLVPAATPQQIRGYLNNGARPFATGSLCAPGGGFAGRCGSGLLDAGLTLAAAAGPDALPLATATDRQQIVAAGATVLLRGSGKAFNGKTISSYQWSQTGGPTVTLNNANSATASFTAPATGTLTFSLQVTDNLGKSGSDLASVRVNSAPVLAAAPAARTAIIGETVSFSVTATDADGDAVTYVAATSSTVPVAALSPNGLFSWTGTAAGTYTLAYFATDGISQSPTQTVTITVTSGGSAANPPTGGGGGGGGSWTWAGIGLLLSLLLLRSAAAARQRKRQSQ